MKRLLPLIPLLIGLLAMEVLVRFEILPAYLVPRPHEIGTALMLDASELWAAAWQTTWTSFVGFSLSLSLGLSLGVLFASVDWIEKAFLPYATLFQTVPIIAIAPLLVIWFGYGTPTIIISSVIVSIFPIIASTLMGIRSTDPRLLDLFKLYSTSRLQCLWKLRLPYALPHIFTGIRVASGLSVIGAIVGEFIAGGGLGGIIDVSRTRQRVDQVFAAVILATLVGIVFLSFTNFIGRRFLRHWHASEKST